MKKATIYLMKVAICILFITTMVFAALVTALTIMQVVLGMWHNDHFWWQVVLSVMTIFFIFKDTMFDFLNDVFHGYDY